MRSDASGLAASQTMFAPVADRLRVLKLLRRLGSWLGSPTLPQALPAWHLRQLCKQTLQPRWRRSVTELPHGADREGEAGSDRQGCVRALLYGRHKLLSNALRAVTKVVCGFAHLLHDARRCLFGSRRPVERAIVG